MRYFDEARSPARAPNSRDRYVQGRPMVIEGSDHNDWRVLWWRDATEAAVKVGKVVNRGRGGVLP